MRVEIPKFTRCCGCLPLRRGIIALGYLNLGFAVLVIVLEISFRGSATSDTTTVFRGANFIAQKWLPVLMYFVEAAFLLVLLVGAHMRRRRLLRIYYYYGITTCAAALVLYIVVLLRSEIQHWGFYIIDACTVFSGIVTQVYLVLLIRSYLEKPMEPLRCVNHLTDVFGQPREGVSLL